jgi:dipeptidase E
MRLFLSSYRLGNRPDELLRLLRGGRRVALIMNAADYKPPAERAESLQRELDELRGAGLDPVDVDLRRYFGRAEALREALDGFDGLYLRGGNVYILRRALRQSGADALIEGLLARDALVYAGYSAGPCMLGPTLCGIESEEDDPAFVPDGYETPVIWDGLGLLPYAVLPHYDPAHPEIQATLAYYIDNHVPFVALRDGEALMVEGEALRVVG